EEPPERRTAPRRLSRRPEPARPAHNPYNAPATKPNNPQARPVSRPPPRKPSTPSLPSAPATAPSTKPSPPQLTTSLLAIAATPRLGSTTRNRPPRPGSANSSICSSPARDREP